MGRKKHGINNELDQLIREVLLPIESRADIVSPRYIAAEVEKRVDPEDIAPKIKTHGFVQYTRARVRAILATRHDPVKNFDADNEQIPLFKGLQEFYPRSNGTDYARRQFMVAADYVYNIERLRLECNTKLDHARALEAEYEEKCAAGLFVDTA